MSSEAIPPFDLSRLEHARIDGPGVALAYMGDDKNHVRLFRAESPFLTLMVCASDRKHQWSLSFGRRSSF